MDELKPCPFCGNTPKESPAGLLIRCGIPCDNSLWYHVSEWQNRPIEDALRAELARVTAERDAAVEDAKALRDHETIVVDEAKLQLFGLEEQRNQLRAERDALKAAIDSPDLLEALAAYSHDLAWSGWMKYQFSKGVFNADGTWTMPAWAVSRWVMQMNTLYIQLPENMRESDRAEARQMLEYVRLAMDGVIPRKVLEGR